MIQFLNTLPGSPADLASVGRRLHTLKHTEEQWESRREREMEAKIAGQ